jgi:hypothetical protein
MPHRHSEQTMTTIRRRRRFTLKYIQEREEKPKLVEYDIEIIRLSDGLNKEGL